MKKQKITPLTNFGEFQKEHSLSQELPFWDFFDDCVALSDGTLVQGLKLEGLSIETLDDNNLNAITLKLRSLLNGLQDNVEIGFFINSHSNFIETLKEHKNLKSLKKSINEISEDRLKMLEEEIKKENLFKKDIYLFIYKRPDNSQSKSHSIFSFFKTPKRFQSITKKEHERRLKELNELTSVLSSSLEAINLKSRKLTKNEIKALIYEFFNPERSQSIPLPQEVTVHREQVFTEKELEIIPELGEMTPRNELLFSDLILQEKDIFYDEFYHRILTLKTLPEYTQSALISKLMNLKESFSFFMHIKVPDQSKELSLLQMKRRMAHSMSLPQNGRVNDLESESQVNATEELLREVIETGQKIFFFQLAVKIKSKSKENLNLKSKVLLHAFRELNGSEGLEESVGAFKVFKTIIPFGNLLMARAKKIKTDNLADFLPIYESYQGRDKKPICLFRNRQKALVKYDPFHSKLPNYNTLVTGSSGSGKSFLNNLILLQSMKQNSMNFIIDIGGSYRKLSHLVGGQYVDIAPPTHSERNYAKTLSFNPFALQKGELSPSPRKVKFLLALLENILTDEEGEKLPKLEKALLEEKIDKLYKEVKNPRLTDFNNLLKNSEDACLVRFSKMLYSWTGDRPYGRLLDTNTSFDLENDFVVFDLKGLSSFPDLQAIMILIITDFILGRVEANDPETVSKKKRILMDECWELLKGKSSSHFMEYCVRTLRKTGSGITFITQGIEEIAQHPIGSAILGNTATKFILMQRGDLKPLKDILKLNEKELELIASLKSQKREFSEAFMVSHEDRAVIRVYPSKREYEVATSDAEDNLTRV